LTAYSVVLFAGTVKEDSTAMNAFILMRDANIHGLAVVDEDGVLTSSISVPLLSSGLVVQRRLLHSRVNRCCCVRAVVFLFVFHQDWIFVIVWFFHDRCGISVALG